jgi:phosphohistidine phosphatase SixA
MVVGHNPSLEEFVSGLIGTSPEDVIVTLSTASIAHLELEPAHWGLVRWGTGRLKLLVAAKYLK